MFLTSNIAQSATSVDGGAVLREEGLVKGSAKYPKGCLLPCAWFGPLYAFFKQN